MRYKRMVAMIRSQLLCWSQVERDSGVAEDGTMSWIPASAERVDARVNGQKTKTASELKYVVQTHEEND
jgi:hypothetical protein